MRHVNADTSLSQSSPGKYHGCALSLAGLYTLLSASRTLVQPIVVGRKDNILLLVEFISRSENI